MLSRDIDRYSRLRYEIRAYMCLVFEQNIKNYMPNMSKEQVQKKLQRIGKEIKVFNALYVLDSNGILYGDIVSPKSMGFEGAEIVSEGQDFSDRAYYYESVREKKSILTDPYPSKMGGKLVVTATYPCYDDNGKLVCVACIDVLLEDSLNFASPVSVYHYFSLVSVVMYSILSVALCLVAILLLFKGGWSLILAMKHFGNLDIKEIFESTILLTLSLAIFDLVKAIFEEEVLGRNANTNNKTIHKTMMRFLGSIIIAIAIEALMLVFKFTITQPDKLLYAVYLMGGVFLLLLGLSIYVKFAYGAVNANKKS